jgi:hypothetical protein
LPTADRSDFLYYFWNGAELSKSTISPTEGLDMELKEIKFK